MKKYLVLFVWLSSIAWLSPTAIGQSQPSTLLKHMLVATFRQGLPADSIRAVDDACVALSQLPVIKSFELGLVKAKKEGLPVTRIYVFGFEHEKDLEVYEKSKEHDNLVKVAKNAVEAVQVIDYHPKQ